MAVFGRGWIYWPSVVILAVGLIGSVFLPPRWGQVLAIGAFAVLAFVVNWSTRRSFDIWHENDVRHGRTEAAYAFQADLYHQHYQAVLLEYARFDPAGAAESRDALATDLAKYGARGAPLHDERTIDE